MLSLMKMLLKKESCKHPCFICEYKHVCKEEKELERVVLTKEGAVPQKDWCYKTESVKS